jgi:hypothetical protein
MYWVRARFAEMAVYSAVCAECGGHQWTIRWGMGTHEADQDVLATLTGHIALVTGCWKSAGVSIFLSPTPV